jgi:hypothetical protein
MNAIKKLVVDSSYLDGRDKCLELWRGASIIEPPLLANIHSTRISNAVRKSRQTSTHHTYLYLPDSKMSEAVVPSQITQGALKYDRLSVPGCLLTGYSAIFNDPDNLQRDFPVPVCQCVQIKVLGSTSEGAQERYRIVLSDVKNFVQSMLATR